MNTTVLFVENIIIGFQGALWIVLLLIARFPELGKIKTWPCELCELKDWSTLITIIAVAFIYSLGIILGRVFNIVATLIPFRVLLRIKWIKEFCETAHKEELVKVSYRVGILKSYYLYISSRTRIAEATMFNLPLILIAASLYLNLDRTLKFWGYVLLLTLLCLVVYVTFLGTIKARNKQVLDVLKNPDI